MGCTRRRAGHRSRGATLAHPAVTGVLLDPQRTPADGGQLRSERKWYAAID